MVVDVPQDPQEGYKVITGDGPNLNVYLEIYCREYRYRISHEAWWMPTYTRREFHVYCAYSPFLSRALQEKLQEGYVSPPILWWASRSDHKKAVISRYASTLVRYFRNANVHDAA